MTPSEGDDTVAAGTGSGGALSAAALGKLERAGGPALVAQLAAMFLEDAPNRFAALKASASDQERVRLAHGFKTNCRMLGTERMAGHCQRLVEMAEAGAEAEERGVQAGAAGLTDLAGFAREVGALETAYAKVRDAVVQLRDAALRDESSG